uniref:Rho-GAP domain-containing protein n=1 Tax=Romanomermis culicivorax TaxID=13658 RepID=A0A915LAD5_ROMCU
MILGNYINFTGPIPLRKSSSSQASQIGGKSSDRLTRLCLNEAPYETFKYFLFDLVMTRNAAANSANDTKMNDKASRALIPMVTRVDVYLASKKKAVQAMTTVIDDGRYT